MTYLAGVDIGGTFTDVVLLDRDTGTYSAHKLLTSSDDPSRAVAAGVRAALDEAGADPAALENVVHGTTLVANTLIQRDGARTALLVTAGFEDLIELRREQRYDPYDLFPTFPEPLVPGPLRIGVAERSLADGAVLTPLDPDALRAQLAGLVDVESVAICFLHSYVQPGPEQAAAELTRAELPGVAVSVSADIVPQTGEYERLSTTVANAYVQPVMDRYLARLEAALRELSPGCELYLMLSDGGITSVGAARAVPVRLLESGPAAGITATARLGERTGDRRLVAFDMGGTTAKFCVVDDGAAQTTWDMEAARVNRFRKGSGLPLRIPSVEMIEIGAGGGSLASVGALGLVRVGPRSAGSTPGPACYGGGGTAPAVTDALLVLGYLNPSYFNGGRLTLSVSAAAEAIEEHVAGPTGTSVEDAALGIYRVACAQMAESMRVHFAERGKDPRAYTMVAFGGAGPAHAAEVARALRVPRVLVPPAAGIMSAAGLLMAPFAFGLAHSYPVALAALDRADVDAVVEKLAAQGRQTMREAGVAEADVTVSAFLDLKYAGQRDALEVPLGPDLVADFERVYSVYHGAPNPALELRVQAVKVRVAGPAGSGWLTTRSDPAAARPATSRPVRFPGLASPVDCPVVSRGTLVAGETHPGPAVVEDAETTTVVGPADTYGLDGDGNLVLTIGTGV